MIHGESTSSGIYPIFSQGVNIPIFKVKIETKVSIFQRKMNYYFLHDFNNVHKRYEAKIGCNIYFD